MWSPTHVQVLVKCAKGLNLKGKNGKNSEKKFQESNKIKSGTNDAFVTISLGKEKFQTSVKEKSTDPVDWSEQCELTIPSHGNTADINLTVLHRNFLGVDEFLGQVSLPLRDFDVYERPKSKWFPLKCKPGQNKNDYRGEIEVKLGFTVKATTTAVGGSIADLNKKNKTGSISSLQKISGSISGSLMSIGKKEKKSIKKIVKAIGHKAETKDEKSNTTNAHLKLGRQLSALDEGYCNEDPGVNSDEEFGNDDDDEYNNDNEDDEVCDVMDTDASSLNLGSDLLERRKVITSRRISEGKLPPVNEDEAVVANIHQGPPVSSSKHLEPPEDRLKGSQSSLPSYNEATSGIFNNQQQNNRNKDQKMNQKKKIIPVQSDFESSSPSPDPLGTPPDSPAPPTTCTVRMSQSTVNLARHQELENERTKKSLGMKLKTSYSFRDHTELVGRVTPKSEISTPILHRSSLPHDVLAQYNGKTREDLIEMVINLQKTVDMQGKKIIDLEDYIDNLLIKILDVAPILLKQDSPLISKHAYG